MDEMAKHVAEYRREQALRRARRDRAERDLLNKLEDVQTSLDGTQTLSCGNEGVVSSAAFSHGERRTSLTALQHEQQQLAEEEAQLLGQLEGLHNSAPPYAYGQRPTRPPSHRVRSHASNDQRCHSQVPLPAPVHSAGCQRQLLSVAERRGRELEQLRHEKERVAQQLEDVNDRLAGQGPRSSRSSGPVARPGELSQMKRAPSDEGRHRNWRPRLPPEPKFPPDPTPDNLGQLRKSYVDQGGRSSAFIRRLDNLATNDVAVSSPWQRSGSVALQQQQQPVSPGRYALAVDDPLIRSLQHRLEEMEMNNQRLLAALAGTQQLHLPLAIEGRQERRGSDQFDVLRRQVDIAGEEVRLQKLQAELQAFKALRQPGASPTTGAHVIDDLGPSPYDPKSGFAVLWDFAPGLPPSVHHCCLSTSLTEDGEMMSTSKSLPAVPCTRDEHARVGARMSQHNVALFSSQQTFPGLSPSSSMKLLTSVRNAEDGNAVLAWTSIDLFDRHHNLQSGRWKVPLRVPPVRKSMTLSMLNEVVQYYNCQVYFRLVNSRDLDAQLDVAADVEKRHRYRYMPLDAPMFMPELSSSTITTGPRPDHWRRPAKQKKAATKQAKKKQPVRKHMRAAAQYSDDESDYSDSGLSALSVVSGEQEQEQDEEEDGGDDEEEKQPTPTPPPPVEEPDVIVDVLGVELWRVKDVGEGKVTIRLVAKRPDGTVCKASAQDVDWRSPTATDSFYKTRVQNFGKEEVHFLQAGLYADCYLLVEVYLESYTSKVAAKPPGSRQKLPSSSGERPPSEEANRQGSGKYGEPTLVAWTFIKIFNDSGLHGGAEGRGSHGDDGEAADADQYDVSNAVHNLRLYAPPVGGSDRCTEEARSSFLRHAESSIRLRLFSDALPVPSLIDESDCSDLEPVELTKDVFNEYDRAMPLSQRYKDGDPIFVFVDGARHLPDNVTVTNATARLLDKHYNPIGKELSSLPYFKSDIYNPHFVPPDTDRAKLGSYSETTGTCLLIHEPQMPRTATLVVKLYTVDGYSKRIATVGYSVLKLFATVPSGEQPSNDTAGIKVALNHGAHQLRIYAHDPPLDDLLTEHLFASNRVLPCASVLVRLCKRKAAGFVNISDLPPELASAPPYSTGVYFSASFKPTEGEKHLLVAMQTRPALQVQNSVPLLGDPSWSQVDRSDVEVAEFIKGKLSRSLDTEPYNLDMTYISKYTPKTGLVLSVDEASNLPWRKVTHAVAAFSLPGAFFTGQFHDSVKYTTRLDWESPLNNPRWQDGLWTFRHRHLHFHLAVVIMLQAVDMIFKRNRQKFQLAEQAWTAVPVFSDGYVFTDRYRLPLFHGRPTEAALEVLQSTVPSGGDLITLLKDVKKVKVIEGASLTVRIADTRRKEEVEKLETLPVNPWYLPEEKRSKYASKKPDKRTMSSLVPDGETTASLGEKIKFRELLLAAMTTWKT